MVEAQGPKPNSRQSNLQHLTSADHFPLENIPFGVFFNKQLN
jgi:hypothetical protein